MEKINKTGVFYKPGNMEEENAYGDNSESGNYGGLPRKEWVYQDDFEELHTPAKMNMAENDDDVMNSNGKDLIIAHLSIGIVSRVLRTIDLGFADVAASFTCGAGTSFVVVLQI